MAEAGDAVFRRGDCDADREAYYRLRYETVVRKGWASRESMPGGLERDEYDDRAIHITGWQGRELTAAARLVLPEEGYTLPTEAVLGEPVPPVGQVVNFDRVIVAPGATDRMVVFRALLAATWLETRAYGFHRWTGLTSLAVIRLYRQMGFSVKVLSGSKAYWGEQRYPVRFEPDGASEALERAGRW